jgi:predicted phosphodiesterase
MKKLIAMTVLMAGLAAISGGGSGISQRARYSDSENSDTGIVLRIGLISDIHYAQKPNLNNRHYSRSLAKAEQAVETFNSVGTDFMVLLGDNIDETDTETDLENLKKLDDVLGGFRGPRHYVLGNHDLGELTKKEFLAQTGGQGGAPYYSFSRGGYYFIVLDGNFRVDGVEYSRGNFEWTDSFIPPDQQKWLINSLNESALQEKKVILFIHQILCDQNDHHGVKNADQVRQILEQHGHVLIVFQGHNHSGSHKTINGIHYVGIHPMVVGESNAYGELTLSSSGKLTLKGYGRQPGIDLIPGQSVNVLE